ncbi:uncharacterized protein LOC128957768 [Oppia nitens]|uniref:uncharacterized protein LOC128957768 n=1 Tax=Oppia nitens TaxID=1686743 RepID=UPI0023D9842A|nr:uncharacterized protein LOC128957768 [Oppia nitens]
MTMSTKIAKVFKAVVILISISDIISCSSLCESLAPNGTYRGSRMYRHWSSVETGHLDQLMLYTRINTTTTHEWQLIINETTIAVNESTFKSLDTPIVNRFGAIFKFQYTVVREEDSYYCYTTFTDSNSTKLITKCELSKPHSEFIVHENTFDFNYSSNSIIFSPRVVKWTQDLDLTYHMKSDAKIAKNQSVNNRYF